MDVKRLTTAIWHWLVGNIAWVAVVKLVAALGVAIAGASTAVAEHFSNRSVAASHNVECRRCWARECLSGHSSSAGRTGCRPQ